MPELPEVETVRRGLEPVLVGATLTQVLVRRPNLRRPFPDRLAERLTGRTVTALRRRAKYLLVDLDGGDALLIHLGMSGRMVISPARPNDLDKHDHFVMETDRGPVVRFNDARRFGSVDWIAPGEEPGHALLRDIGPEPLGEGFSAAQFADALAGRFAPIKAVLLDQRQVAGIGNIYACEALYMAAVHPARAAGDLTDAETSRLVNAVKAVLAAAIEAGGSTLRDHQQPNGELGYFQHRFQVYGRADEACPRCGAGAVIERLVQSGRSSFFCATCQT
jgi:formamidopyrimidine-DNA glycosylase